MDHFAYAEGRLEQRVGAAVLKLVDELRPPVVELRMVYALQRKTNVDPNWRTIEVYSKHETAMKKLAEKVQQTTSLFDDHFDTRWCVQPYHLNND